MPGNRRDIRRTVVMLSGATPADFRIFRSGWNESSKGRFLFDDVAAAELMAEYKKAGVRVMIDLEHLSLDQESNAYDPDARGWCDLDLRNGELWAVRVTWTPDGKRRLEQRTQNYISPAFSVDSESKRIVSLYNIAICAIPATYEAPALVAASKRTGKSYVTLSIEVTPMDELKKVCEALGLKDDATLEDILAAIKALREDEGEGEDGDEDEALADDDKDAKDSKDDDEEKELAKLPPKLQAKVMAALHAKPDAALRHEIEEIKANQRKSEVEGIISANTDKIPLSLEKWARKQTPDTLREYLKHAASVPRSVSKEKEREGGDAEVVALTDAEKQLCKLQKIEPAKLLAFKKAQAEEAKEKTA